MLNHDQQEVHRIPQTLEQSLEWFMTTRMFSVRRQMQSAIPPSPPEASTAPESPMRQHGSPTATRVFHRRLPLCGGGVYGGFPQRSFHHSTVGDAEGTSTAPAYTPSPSRRPQTASPRVVRPKSAVILPKEVEVSTLRSVTVVAPGPAPHSPPRPASAPSTRSRIPHASPLSFVDLPHPAEETIPVDDTPTNESLHSGIHGGDSSHISPSSDKDLSRLSSKNVFARIREVGNTALALTRIQKIIPNITLDELRERGVDVNNLERIVDRMPRFLNRFRGRLMLNRLRTLRVERDPAKLLLMMRQSHREAETEHMYTDGDVNIICLARGRRTTWRVPPGTRIGFSATHVEFATPVHGHSTCLLSFGDMGGIELHANGASLTFSGHLLGEGSDADDANSSVELVIRGNHEGLVTKLLTIASRRTRLERQLVRQALRKKLHVVHFNDVYHLEAFKHPDGPGVTGGASRFCTKLRQIQQERNPLVLFSGDFMSPSLQSVLMRGKHMIDAFNLLGVQFGTFGNHEFDYGLEPLHDCIHGHIAGNFVFAGSNTRWIMSNMNGANGEPLCGSLKFALVTWNGVRVGLLGLSENWLPSCNQLGSHEAYHLDQFAEGEKLAQELKRDGAEIVIALTHSRVQTDKEMSVKCPSIDLILGGHDHFYKRSPKHRLVKSGEEFEYLTELELTLDDEGKLYTQTTTHPIVKDIPVDPGMETIIERYQTRVQQRMGKVIGITTVPLDCTEECCRFKEGILPGFFCDVMVERTKADFAVLGGAAIAGKAVMSPGDITLGDVFNWFPGDTRVMTVRIPGSTVKKLLDVMVREVPAEAPSFPHPSEQLHFAINTMHTPATVQDITIQGEPLDPVRMYTVAVEDFVGLGKAKYKFIPKEGAPVVDDEAAEQITYWIIEYFEAKRKKRTKRASISMKPDAGEDSMFAVPPSIIEHGDEPEHESHSQPRSKLARIAHAAMTRTLLQRKSAAEAYKKEAEATAKAATSLSSSPTTIPQQTLLRLLTEASSLPRDADVSLDTLSTEVCYAMQRLVACDVVRLFHCTFGETWCLAPVCTDVKPTRVAAHTHLGMYNYVRRSKLSYFTNTPREDEYFHRPSEGHPRGERLTSVLSIPVHYSETYSCVMQLVNLSEELTPECIAVTELFANHVGTLLHLAHQREVKQASEILQKKVLEAAIELLGGEDLQETKLLDQLANMTRMLQRIFGARLVEVYMVDYATDEVWTVHRVHTSKKTYDDVIIRKSTSSDSYISRSITSGLPTLHDNQNNEGEQQSDVLAIPVFSPGSEDVLCVLRLADRQGGKKFTTYDEDAAVGFSAFVAVAIQTISEVEALRTGVNRAQLKLFPLHDLGRIRWKRGWGSVRSKLRTIISDAFRLKLTGEEDRLVWFDESVRDSMTSTSK